MSLTNRLTAFWLVALAVVLAGFCVTLDGVARSYLLRHADERLDAAVRTLVAAIEFDDEGLEWEPAQRRVAVGQDTGADHVRWVVRDGRGAVVASSRNLEGADFLAHLKTPAVEAPARPRRVNTGGEHWRVAQRRLRAERVPAAPVENHHAELILTAGLRLAPLEATVRNLGWTLTGLSLSVWSVAAVLGHFLCRRALVPVTRMAEAARDIGAAEFGRRLPDASTGDELRDLGDAFNGLLARLEDAFERQRRFTGDASHQLRTPLAAMLGQVEVALRRERPAEDYRRVLALVRDQATHLSRLVEMLLFLARADAEARRPDLETIDLASWAADHLALWAEHPRASDLSLVHAPGGPLRVQAHRPLLAQLVDNLMENACKYSEPGTPVTLHLERSADAVLLTVADEGSGIDPAEVERVFEPFYRSPRARRGGRSGVGLGLAVARRIATALGGSLRAGSALRRGSRFTLELAEVRAAEVKIG